MFCKKCGAELYPGAKFCGVCGASSAATDNKVNTSLSGKEHPSTEIHGEIHSQVTSARYQSRRRIPVALVVALVILGLATLASAAYLVYTQVLNPNPPVQEESVVDSSESEGAEDKQESDNTEAEQDSGNAETQTDKETSTDETVDDGSAAAAEEVAPPAVVHDYECDAFYVDVPDYWVMSDESVNEEGQINWSVTDNGDGTYLLHQSDYAGSSGNTYVYVGVPAPSYCTYYGTTSDGRDVYVGTFAGGSFLDTDATLTLK